MSESPRILVVDDDPSIRLVAAACLERIGSYRVLTAASTDEALRQLDHECVDLVLLDVRLGVEHGVDALRRIRETPRNEGLPVAFFTACILPEEREQLLGHGVVGVVEKPFDPEGLCSSVGDCLQIGALVGEQLRADRSVLEDMWCKVAPEVRKDVDELARLVEGVARWSSETQSSAGAVCHRLAGVLGMFGRPDAGQVAARLSGLIAGSSLDEDDHERMRRMIGDIRRMADLRAGGASSSPAA